MELVHPYTCTRIEEKGGRRVEEAREREVERLGMVWEEGEKRREEVGVHAARIVRKKAPRLFLTNGEEEGDFLPNT